MTPELKVSDSLTLPVDLVTESNALLGKKGSGKTNAGMVLLEEIYAAGVPVVSIDPKGDHYGIRAGRDGSQKGGLPIPVFGGLHGDIPLEPTAGAYLADLVIDRRLSLVLDVSEFTAAERRRFLTAFTDRIYRHSDRNPMHLVLEEAHEYIPQFVGKEDAAMVGVFERLVKLGRFKGIGVTMMSQRSASLNKNVLTQVDNLFVLRTVSPQDRAAVKLWIDTHADSAEIMASLPSLATGECWLWQPGRGEPVHFQFRMRSTYDAGETPKVGETRKPPATLADVDLSAISAAMAETIEKAKADDPKMLRARVAELQRQLDARPTEEVVREIEKVVEVPVLTDFDRGVISGVHEKLGEVGDLLDELRGITAKIVGSTQRPPARHAPTPQQPARARAVRLPKALLASTEPTDGEVHLRAGAHRMVEALGRMAPLRLTKSQWGTVAKLKTSGGTWTTYLGDIRRAGLIDENSIGYTLTEGGFEYLGGQPDPMTPEELQDHYRSILRSGAAKMLDALIEAHPEPLSRAELGDAAGIAISGGTFSTYLGDLTRNGLAERNGDLVTATDILMYGARA